MSEQDEFRDAVLEAYMSSPNPEEVLKQVGKLLYGEEFEAPIEDQAARLVDIEVRQLSLNAAHQQFLNYSFVSQSVAQWFVKQLHSCSGLEELQEFLAGVDSSINAFLNSKGRSDEEE